MANIRPIDLGAPPSSVVPVYQDVYAAGAVGRAAMAVGRGISDVGEAMYNVNQRRQSLAADATYAKFLEGHAELESSIKEYQAKNPTDYDGLRKKAEDGQANLVRSVADFAKRQGLEGTRFEMVQSRVNASLSELTGDVRARIEKARVLEADEQLENTATLLRNSGKDKEADAAIDSMQSILPSKKEELKRFGRLQGMVVRTRAEINSAQSTDELSAVKRQLNAKNADGMYEYSPEMPLNSRMELLEVVDRRNAALTMAKISEIEKEAARIAKESVKNANAYLASQTTADAKNNFAMAVTMLGDQTSFNKQLGSGVSDEVKGKLFNALSSMSFADREALVGKAERQAASISDKEEKAGEKLASDQSAKAREVRGAIDKGTMTIATINELEREKKLNSEDAQAARDQVEQSFMALAASEDDLADSINLKLYNAVKKNGGFAGVEGFKGMDVDPISDYEELRTKILAKGNGMSEESKFRAMQNVAFLQMYDIADGDIDAGWSWDETLQPEVREWMQGQLFDVVKKSDRTGMSATEIGNRLFNVIDTGKRLNRMEGDKLKKQIEVETKVLNESGGLQRARAAFKLL